LNAFFSEELSGGVGGNKGKPQEATYLYVI